MERIRIGMGLGTRTELNDARLGPFLDHVEQSGFDSIWFSERIGGQAPDPLVAMAYAAGRTEKLKFGMSVMVLPGRNPVLLAKAMASLDRVSGGRLLPAFGLGIRDPKEQQGFGVERKERAAWFDEALPLMRELWSGQPVTHHGDRFTYDELIIEPTPQQDPLEVWLGGIAPAELRRVGRLGDGWLPSFCTPDEVRAGITTVNETAADHGREIDPGHMGVLVAYRRGPLPHIFEQFIQKRRPGIDPDLLVPEIVDLPTRLSDFIETGASKFVVVPLVEPEDWHTELDELETTVLPLQQ